MKKTLTVNISGFVFNIEEDAYRLLDEYLKAIALKIFPPEESAEVIRDVESRIAELFKGKINPQKEVITAEDVKEIQLQMGAPDDFAINDGEASPISDNGKEDAQTEKRMYRDTEHAKLGGVCSGLGAYLGVDPTIIRIIFVLMVILGGSGFFIYLILLFVIPEAKTTTDKLKMRGAPININNIKDHINILKNDLSDKAKKSNFKEAFNETVNSLPPIINQLFRWGIKLTGFVSVTMGIFGLFALSSVFLGESGFLPITTDGLTFGLTEGVTLLYGQGIIYGLTLFSILTTLYIPLILFILWGIKLLFTFKTSLKPINLVLAIFWFVGIGILTLTSIGIGLDMRNSGEVVQSYPVTTSLETLVIDVEEDDIFSNYVDAEMAGFNDLVLIKNETVYLGNPKLYIKPVLGDSAFSVQIIKEMRGATHREAVLKAEQIKYTHLIWNNHLTLSPYLAMPLAHKYRQQSVSVIVYVPAGKSVKFGKNIERLLQPLGSSDKDPYTQQYAATTWMSNGTDMVLGN
jgi:phage shock protein PspC (stress-responsive transcriptional regulator)